MGTGVNRAYDIGGWGVEGGAWYRRAGSEGGV